MRVESVLIILFFQLLTLPVSAAEEPLKVLDFVPNPHWEKEKANARAIKYFEKAQQLKELKKYPDALYHFDLALKQDPEFKLCVEKEQAQIYLQTGLKDDAERLMRRIVNVRVLDDPQVEAFVKLLIGRRKTAEAVQVCQRLCRSEPGENHQLLLCTALKANGQKHEAIELARTTYLKLARTDNSYGSLKKFLEQNGVKVKLTYDTSQNSAFLDIVKRISKLKRTISPLQVAAIFPSKDKERGWVSRSKVATCAVCKGNPWQIRLANEELNSSRIKIYPDSQHTCITRQEVERIFGNTQKKEASWGMHGNGVPERLEYFDRDPSLRFDLSGPRGFWRMPPSDPDAIQHVTEVQITWKEGRFTDPPAAPYVPPKPVPDEIFDAQIQEAENAFNSADYRRAATLIMKNFQEGHNTKRSGYERYLRRKKLLIDCYTKLGRKDIAEVIGISDYATLGSHIEQAFGYKTLLMPTMDEFQRERWRAIGGWEGQISIHGTGWLITGVEKDNPNYSEFVKLIGPLKDGEERLVPPLPARLIDPTLFDPGVAERR